MDVAHQLEWPYVLQREPLPFFYGTRVVGPLLAFPQVQRHDGCATRMALAVDLSARGQRLTFLKTKS